MNEDDNSPPPDMAKPRTSFLAARKAAVTPKAGHGGTVYGLGAKMLAQMGYVHGQGLGSDGRGIVNPIEQNLRPKGLGLGGVKEKSKQDVQEARRRGQAISSEDESSSSDSDHVVEFAKRKSRSPQDGSTRNKKSRKRKVVYRTVEEIEASGLAVPQSLKNIVDMTGSETKVLSDMMDFQSATLSVEEQEQIKIAETARKYLESYAEEWNTLQNQRKYISMEESRIIASVKEEDASIARLGEIMEIVTELQSLTIETQINLSEDIMHSFGKIGNMLEDLQTTYPSEIERLRLDEVAVAAIHPIFKLALVDWNPLVDPKFLRDNFEQWHNLLRIRNEEHLINNFSNDFDITHHGRRRHLLSKDKATLFESMMASVWLPRVRTVLSHDWDVRNPTSLILLFEAWEGILPFFIKSQLLEQVVFPRIQNAVHSWNPGVRSSNKTNSSPELWLFPWMPYLGDKLRDVLIEVKRKLGRSKASGPTPL